MPIFEAEGKKYNVQDAHIAKFAQKYPKATTIMERNGQKYKVKASDLDAFNARYSEDSTEQAKVQTPNILSDSLLNNSGVHPDSTIAQLREDTKKREEAAEKAYNESEVIYNEDKPYRPASVPQPTPAPAEGVVKSEQEAEKRAKEWVDRVNADEATINFRNSMAKHHNDFAQSQREFEENTPSLMPAQREFEQKMDEINQAQRFGEITTQEADVKRKALEAGNLFASTPTDDMIRRTNARGVAELSKELDEKIAEREKEVEQEWAKKYAEDSALVKGGNLRERIYAANQVQDYTPFVARESDPEYMTLVAAKRSLEDAQKLIDEADRTLNAEDYSRASQRWHSGLARGAKDQLFDVRTWDMGISEAKDMAMLSYALDKEENGEELTEAEKALLDAKAYEMAVNAYFGSYLGKGYKVGVNVGAMAPFMLEMAINPLSAVGSSVQSKLVRSALKKYGKGLYQRKLKYNALKYGSRLVGDIAGAAGMTLTSSFPRTYADAVSRHIGNVKPEYADYTGRAEFGGTEGGVSAGRAAYEAIAAGTTERLTEMSSYYFTRPFRGMKLPKLDNKAVKAVSNFVQNANNTDLARIGGEIAKKTQWGGVAGEFFEEVENNILNAALVGDMKFDNSEEGVFNLQNNWLTLQSVAAVGGSIATLKTGYYPIYKYQQSRALKQADLQAADAFGEEWGGIKTSLNGLDEQSFANLIALGKREDVTPMQKEAAKNYFQANVNLHAAQQAAIKHLSDAKTSPEEVEISQSYDIGRSLYTPEEMNEAKRELEDAKADVRRIYALEEDRDVDEFLGETPLESIRGSLDLGGSMEEAEIKLRYLNAKAKYDGMLDAVSDKVNDEVETSNRMVDSLVNKDMGGIVNATITSAESEDGEAVTIVSGVIATDKDGNIDRDNTDSFLVYKDKDGSLKPISKDRLMSAQPMVDVEAYKEQLTNEIVERNSNEEGAKIDGILPMNVGDTFYVMDEQGLAHQAQVTGNFEDGSVAISLDNGNPQQMPREAVQAMANAYKDAEYQEKKAAQEEKERADMQQTEAQLQQEQEAINRAEEEAMQAEQPQTATSRVPIGENGNLLYEQADSDTAWDALVEQAKGNEATAQKIADMGVKKAQKALNEVKQSSINEDMSIEEMLEAENAHNDAVAAAEANLNKWKEIASVPQRRAEEAQRVAEQETKAEAMQERIDKANEAISEEQKKAEQSNPYLGRSLTSQESKAVIALMENNAQLAPELELTPENWVAEFGEDGVVSTPIGDVKMGENQYLKLLQRKRSKYFGLIKPTLTDADIILEEYDPKDGAERDTKLLFIKTFTKEDGSRYIHFESVTVKKDTKEVSISSHEINATDLQKKMHNDNVVHLKDTFLDSELRLIEPQAEGSDIVPTPNASSDNKDTTTEPQKQENSQENSATPQMRADEGAQPAGKKLSRAMNMLRIPLRKRANMWSKKVGVPAVIVEDFSDVTSQKAKANILEAESKNRRVTGWVEDGKVYLYMPNLRDIDEIDETYTHEVVGHKGMDAMLGKEEYRKFCLDVFDQVMTEADRKTYLNYEGVSDLKDETEKKAKAADEYIAHLSESTKLTKREAKLWDKIVDLFRKMLESLGFPQDISKLTIEDMIRKSYRNLLENKDAGKLEDTVIEAAQNLEENGAQVDVQRGDVRNAVRDVLSPKQKEKTIKDIMTVTGRSRSTVEKWLKAEQSLAKIILDDDNVAFLDLQVDESVPSIWNNSDYPQGTVEFSNICRKRLPLTMIYQQLQKEYPNTVFDAATLETIRGVLKENGIDVACGLCFVEDRRQLLGEIGQGFIDALKGKDVKLNDKQKEIVEKIKASGDTYIPNLYELITLDGMKEFKREHNEIANAFVAYNSARGMQAGRLFQAYSAYHREILKYNKKKIKSINDAGGLRIFSFSDFEAHHLIDLVQVLTDCASKGIKVQGYTKVPEFARAVKATNMKVNRSLIAKGDGVVDADYVPQQGEAVSPNVINGKRLLLDTVEGIDVNHPDFFDSSSSANVGNILVGINDEHIRQAMLDPFVDYIIPFHTGIKKDILKKKGIDSWQNYKLEQLEHIRKANGKESNADKHGINIYTEVLSDDIQTEKQFVERYLEVCKEKGWLPKFHRFLDKGKNGDFKYTKGYYKLLLDFKLFNKNGRILPQEAVVPIFDNELNGRILEEYAEGERTKMPNTEVYDKVKDALQEEGKIQFSVKDNETTETIFATAKEKFGTTYDMREAGYILPDGSMLDFSGKHEIRGADTSFLNGQRSVDHRAIQDIAYDFDENETGVKTDLGDFLDRGAIRIDYNTGAINLNNAPTKAQKERLKRLIERNGGDVYIDFGKGWDTEHYVEYESARASRVLGDIDRYYEEGIKPSSNIRFRVADDIAAEQEQIIAEAKANGTYLKAPNGKYTNLTPEQWAMVRTKAFKNWFGDWERAMAEVPILKALKAHGFNNFAEARKWAKENIAGTYNNQEIGDVNISKTVIGKYLSQKAVEQSVNKDEHLSTLRILPQVLESSIVGEIHRDRDNNANIKDVVRLFGCVDIDGTLYRVKTTIKRYVDVNTNPKAYSYEVTEIELLGGHWAAHTQGADSAPTPNNSITIAKLLKGVKKSNSNEEILSYSQVVDENGEPKVVYHGTPKGGFSIFETKPKGKTEDTGAWFASDRSNALTYSGRNYEEFATPFTVEDLMYLVENNEAYKGIRIKEAFYIKDEEGNEWKYDTLQELEDDGWYDYTSEDIRKEYILFDGLSYIGTYSDEEVGDMLNEALVIAENTETPMLYEAFLNIRDPYIIDAEGKNWQDLDSGSTDATAREGRYAGYDGTIIKNVEDGGEVAAYTTTDYIVHTPNQIKSATENVGTFDAGNNDIRFRFIGEKGAANIDKAEEATIRLDNLAIARLMEAEGNTDKSIKMATGWERGADGKWRYEVNDDITAKHIRSMKGAGLKKIQEARSKRMSDLDKFMFIVRTVGVDRLYDDKKILATSWSDAQKQNWLKAYKMYKDDREGAIEDIRKANAEYNKLRNLGKGEFILYEVLGNDNSLFKEYPQLRNVNVVLKPYKGGGDRGNYNRLTNTITIIDFRGIMENDKGEGSANTLVHEIQHIIQSIEGFARGGNTIMDDPRKMKAKEAEVAYQNEMFEDAVKERNALSGQMRLLNQEMMSWWDNNPNATWEDALADEKMSNLNKQYSDIEKQMEDVRKRVELHESALESAEGIDTSLGFEGYKRLAGEVEARNVERRRNMSLGERRNSLAWETEDVARKDQIFIEDALGENSKVDKTVYPPTQFRVTQDKARFDELQEEYDALDKNDEAALNAWRDKKVGVVRDYLEGVAQRFGMKPEIVVFNGADEAQMKEAYDRLVESYRKSGATPPSYEAFKNRSLNPKVGATYRKGGDIITFNLSTKDARNDKSGYGVALFHENAHSLSDSLYSAKELAEIWDSVKNDKNAIVERIQNSNLYKEKSDAAKGGEFISFSIQKLAEDYKWLLLQYVKGEKNLNAEDVVKKLGNKRIKANFAIAEILNQIRDEYQSAREQRNGDNLLGGVGNDGLHSANEGRTGSDRGAEGRINSRARSRSRLLDSVSQKGLRGVVSEDALVSFFKGVYNRVDNATRNEIYEYVKRNGNDFWKGTEQYLASLAENDTPLDGGVRDAFVQMLNNNGIEAEGLTDNDIRYMMWRTNQLKDNKGALSVAEDVVMKQKLGVDNAQPDADTSFRVVSNGRSIRDKYDKRVNTGKGKLKATAYNFQEAMQDEMLSLKIYQQLLEEAYGVNIPSYLNVYNAENSLSSRNKVEMDRFVETLYEGLMQEIDELIKAGATEQEVRDYVVAKSGIERSIEFTVRDYINEQAEATGMRKLYEEKRDALRDRLNAGEISFDEWVDESLALAQSYTGKEVTDAAGLTEMAKRMGLEDKDWLSNARKVANEFENKYNGKVVEFDDKINTHNLWNAINACNNATLKKLYDTGVISKDLYDKLQKQFMFYVPMSGFTEDVAEDVYSYIGNETGAFTPPIKKAGGRLSESDDPFAIIGNKMQSAILQGNRNAMKIKFLNLHRQFPTDLITEGRFWEVKQPDGSWQVEYPEIPSKDASAEVVKATVDEFNERMKRLKESGDARIYRGKANVPYKITHKSHENQHQITVRLMGEPITMFVNGNPQLAKAINGKLKSTTTFWLYNVLAPMNRYMSSIVTSFNPDFVAPNVVRDVQQAFTMTLMDYGVKDAGKLAGLLPKALATTIKYANDIDIDPEIKTLYEEFLLNGGQTGYSHIDDVDKWKSRNKSRIDRLSGVAKVAQGAVDGFVFAKDGISTINGFFEDTTRFATYMLNRQNGKSIGDSIKAAKDISTNFNKKGSGATEGIWGAAAEFLRHWIMFFNPMVQGAYQHWDKMKKHTKKYALITAWNIGLGFTAALLNDMGSADDDEEMHYLNQNEYTRRSNLFIYIGGRYIKIPLAPIFREYYAIGDIIYTAIKGRITAWQATKAIFNTVRSIFSLEGQSSLTGKDGEKFRLGRFVAPDALAVIPDIAENANFMGSPIYRDALWDELKPEYEKVYNGTWQPLINISKGINNMMATDIEDETLSKHTGKIAAKNSSILINPAVWQYAIEQATGGIGSTIGNTINTVGAVFDPEREVEWNSVPIIRRFYTVPNERNRSRNLQNDYYEITQEQKRRRELYDFEKADTEGKADEISKQLQAEESAYLDRVKETKNDAFGRAELEADYHSKEKEEDRKNRLAEANRLREQFKAYQESADGQFYLKTEEIIKAVDKLRREIKKVEDDDLKKQKKAEMEAKQRELVELWKANERN